MKLKGKCYVTDNFFLLLGIDKVTLPLSYEQFKELFKVEEIIS